MIDEIRKSSCVLLLFLLASCSIPEPDVTGVWKVENDFFNATYRLSLGKEGLSALVLKYDDGTMRIDHDVHKEQYLFKGLVWENESYVDGVSGATRKGSWDFRLVQKGRDTLQVEQQMSGRILKEFWIRSEEEYETF